MWRALQEIGVKPELVIYPRERHSLRGHEHIRDLRGRVVDWFSSCV